MLYLRTTRMGLRTGEHYVVIVPAFVAWHSFQLLVTRVHTACSGGSHQDGVLEEEEAVVVEGCGLEEEVR